MDSMYSEDKRFVSKSNNFGSTFTDKYKIERESEGLKQKKRTIKKILL